MTGKVALCMALSLGLSIISTVSSPAQNTDSMNKWFDTINQRYPNLNKTTQTGDIKKTGQVQKPGAMQTPGDIQVPHGLKAIKKVSVPCSQRFLIGADTLFEFDKASLNPRAEETLKVLAPMIMELGPHPIKIEGHTDSIGTDDYNQQLSERRAERVKNWMLEHHVAPREAFDIIGFGEKKPVAPNTKPDKSDNPAGRALNRRVEIVVNTCKTLEEAAKEKEAALARAAQPQDAQPQAAQPQDAQPQAAQPQDAQPQETAQPEVPPSAPREASDESAEK